jgi:hypothetical protein
LDTVPGNGFDFTHLSAINGDLAVKAAIDPVTELRLRAAERVGCGTIPTSNYVLALDGGYQIPGDDDQQPAQAPQPDKAPPIIVLEQAPAAQPSAQPAGQTQEAGPPVPDQGQFILVLRDGTKVQAVAFERRANQVIYITTDGARLTMAVSDLDTSATIRVNEERGTPLELSL